MPDQNETQQQNQPQVPPPTNQEVAPQEVQQTEAPKPAAVTQEVQQAETAQQTEAPKTEAASTPKPKVSKNKKKPDDKKGGKPKRNTKPVSNLPTKKSSDFKFHRISPVATAMSIKHFATMLRSGLSLEEVLEILATQNIDEKLSATYAEILISVRSGKTLAITMKDYPDVFSDVVVSIIDIGEKGATLEKNLDYLSDFLKDAYELQKKIKGAMTYPVIVLSVTVLEMFGVFFFIIPRLENLFKAFDDPPATTLAIINFSKIFRENIVAIIVVHIIVGFSLAKFLKTPTGKSFKDRLGLKFPVFKKLNRSSTIASFSRTMGILLESGIPISDGMVIAGDTCQNVVYRDVIYAVSKDIKKGNNLSTSLGKYPNLFPNTYIKMVEVGESTGTLEGNLAYLHDFYTEEVKDIADNLTTLLEPMLMIFIGIMVGGLAVTVILPIYQLIGNINS